MKRRTEAIEQANNEVGEPGYHDIGLRVQGLSVVTLAQTQTEAHRTAENYQPVDSLID